MTEPLDTLIHYRLERAQESLDEARLLARCRPLERLCESPLLQLLLRRLCAARP